MGKYLICEVGLFAVHDGDFFLTGNFISVNIDIYIYSHIYKIHIIEYWHFYYGFAARDFNEPARCIVSRNVGTTWVCLWLAEWQWGGGLPGGMRRSVWRGYSKIAHCLCHTLKSARTWSYVARAIFEIMCILSTICIALLCIFVYICWIIH